MNTKQELIKSIFREIDPNKIRSSYTEYMITTLDDSFIRFLSHVMTDFLFKAWKEDPNNEEILNEICAYGFDFYKHHYIGNPGG